MNVLIDDCLSTLGALGGIGHQSLCLAKHLGKFVQCDFQGHRHLRFIPRVARKLSYIGLANLEALRKEYDVIHYQNHYVPILKGRSKKVVTINDLSVFRFPETVPVIWRAYNRHAIAHAVSRADAIVTLSVFIKEELLTMFGHRRPEDVFVCPAGIRGVFLSELPHEERIRRFGLRPWSYFLYLGDLTRRKNLGFLVRCYLEAKKRSVLSPETALVLAGKPYWGYHEIRDLLRKEEGIVSLGYVDDADIVSLYHFSLALVYPSIYEGFGMPIIEAMSQNIPIIVSNIPTSLELNKTHNNQMIVFELGVEESLVAALAHVEQNSDLVRAALQYGDLSIYQYDQIAQRHVEVYNKILRR